MKRIAWTAFVATNLATAFAASNLGFTYLSSSLLFLKHLNFVLSLLALTSLALGIWAIRITQHRLRSFLIVLIVLAIGQLWWIESTATRIIWSINGFV
jgi:hypothetical protein